MRRRAGTFTALAASTLGAAALLTAWAVRADDRAPLDRAPLDRAPLAPLSVDEVKKALDEPGAHDAFVPEAPLGLDEDAIKAGVPGQDPLTRAKVALGRQLFFDPRLSKDRTISCATCHEPANAYASSLRLSIGVGGKLGSRHAPALLDRIFGTSQFWDGRAATLEEQALGPIANPAEMALPIEEAIARLDAIAGYRVQFERIFGTTAKGELIGRAIAAFERTLLSGNSPSDVAEASDRAATEENDPRPEVRARAARVLAAARARPVTESESRGRFLFFRHCTPCHLGKSNNFTDEHFYNIGVGSDSESPDPGREAVTKKPEDRGKFKVPSLRNVADRHPYMHDGSLNTLEAVVDFYDGGGKPNKNLSGRIRKLDLGAQGKADLVAFLRSLSGERALTERPRLPAD